MEPPNPVTCSFFEWFFYAAESGAVLQFMYETYGATYSESGGHGYGDGLYGSNLGGFSDIGRGTGSLAEGDLQ
jgi:hypothetical protein